LTSLIPAPGVVYPGEDCFEELAATLGWQSSDIIVTLVGYFDETGDSDDPRISVIGVAGAIAPLESWVRLECEWQRITRGLGVSEVHMKHLAHFQGEFTGWTEERRRDLLAPIFALMGREVSDYIGAVMALPEEWRASPADLRSRLADPYYGCAISCFQACASYPALEPGRQTKVVFARRRGLSGFAGEIYEAYKETQADGDRLGSFVVEPLRLPQLQVADIVAYELGHCITDRIHGIQRTRWTLEQLKTKGTRYLKIKRLRTNEERL
jgi:hypothetical protein